MHSFVPLAIFWIGKLIIDDVLTLRASRKSALSLIPFIAAELLLVAGDDVLGRASRLVEDLFGELFSTRISIKLIEHAATLDQSEFENPTFYDKLERARRQTLARVGLLSGLMTFGEDLLGFGAMSIARRNDIACRLT